jgi:AcrR family transcriptional regulator
VSPTAQRSLRERKKDETRERLIQAGIELFTQQGYENTSVEEIAERAVYSRATFFRYFASKEDVVFDTIAQEVTTIGQSLEADDAQERPLEVVRRWITQSMLALSAEASDEVSSLQAARTALIFREPALRRRLLELRSHTDDAIAAYLAKVWGMGEPTVECHVIACCLTGVSRAVSQADLWWDRKQMVKQLDRGFAALEFGIDWDCPAGTPPFRVVQRRGQR